MVIWIIFKLQRKPWKSHLLTGTFCEIGTACFGKGSVMTPGCPFCPGMPAKPLDSFRNSVLKTSSAVMAEGGSDSCIQSSWVSRCVNSVSVDAPDVCWGVTITPDCGNLLLYLPSKIRPFITKNGYSVKPISTL